MAGVLRRRMKVWWLMALVAAVALSIRPLTLVWEWHRDMLEWSQDFVRQETSYRKSAAALKGIANGMQPKHWRRESILRDAAECEKLADTYSNMAMFPWLAAHGRLRQ